MNNYYVYEWIRLDTNEPFYVGKGKDDRWKELTRGKNEHFNNIVKNIPCVVNILHENLEEKVAYHLEVWYIREYRDVIGYKLVNITDGGEGQSLCGSANGFYGRVHSDKSKEEIGIKSKERNQGKNNPFYGKSHTEESKKKMKGRVKSEEERKKISERGKTLIGAKNPNAKPIICITTKKIFQTIKEAQEFYGIKRINFKHKTNGKLNDGTPLIWKRLIWKHSKKYKIKVVNKNEIA